MIRWSWTSCNTKPDPIDLGNRRLFELPPHSVRHVPFLIPHDRVARLRGILRPLALAPPDRGIHLPGPWHHCTLRCKVEAEASAAADGPESRRRPVDTSLLPGNGPSHPSRPFFLPEVLCSTSNLSLSNHSASLKSPERGPIPLRDHR